VWLLVGLGNPGPKYQGTRHNIGFHVIDRLASRAGASPSRAKLGAEIAEGRLGSERVLLCKPMEFMNVSGQPVTRVASFYKVEPSRTVVVHDDLDLPFGTLRLRARGSAGTHNGMRSIVQLLGSQVFPRLRVGIDRVPPRWDAARYVLSRFSADEEAQIEGLTAQVDDAVGLIVREGLVAAMNRVNAPEPRGSGGGAKPA